MVVNLGIGGVFVLAQLGEEQVVGAQGLQRQSKRIVSDAEAKQAYRERYRGKASVS